MVSIAVILCTHNPRKDFLSRTLASLNNQSLTKERWELILIDNASKLPLKASLDLSWHPNSRIVREEQKGQTFARLRGIAETKSDLIVFCDDDNLLAHNYLETAETISKHFPEIGAFGASIEAEYETPPQKYVIKHLEGLAVCPINRDYWTNHFCGWTRATPYGAGMCARTSVAREYSKRTINSPIRRLLGRSGSKLGAGDDTDLAWTSLDMGMGIGRFHGLKLTHLIPSIRLQPAYLIELNAGFSESATLLSYLRGGIKPGMYPIVKELLRLIFSLNQTTCLDRRIRFARWLGVLKARRSIQIASVATTKTPQ